jgi:uncharacterized protein
LDEGTRHLPHPVVIEAYGKGGFRLAGLSHRGSLLCLPDGIWPWPVDSAAGITEVALAPVFDRAEAIGLFLLGTGDAGWSLPQPLRSRFDELKIAVEVSRTGHAVATYNILLGEGRRVAAGLIAAA